MNIWQIIVIILLVCIGFYTLFLMMRTMIEIRDYMEKHEIPEPNINKSLTQRVLGNVIAFCVITAISFCPIFNILVCMLLSYIENNKDEIFEEVRTHIIFEDYLK